MGKVAWTEATRKLWTRLAKELKRCWRDMLLIRNNFNHYLYGVFSFLLLSVSMNFVIFSSPSDNFEVNLCLILFITYNLFYFRWIWRLDALLVLLLAWSRECLHEKENWKVFKDDLFNSFCGWFDKQNVKQEFF